jgi:UDPglucose 6-dehydrogenase
MKVAVIGCGYVGLVTGAGLASIGHHVVGVESDPQRLAAISVGTPPFHEPGLPALLESGLRDGAFEATADLDRIVEADVVFVAVQTPPGENGSIDLSFVREAARRAAETLATQPRRRVLAIRSTVLPGTTDALRTLFDDRTAVAANPEFLQEGTAVQDFLRSDRIVVGVHEAWARELLAELYAPLGAPFVASTPATAELAKYASNALLATLISFSNEFASISESFPDVDVEEVLGAVHLDRRLSPRVDGAVVRPGILAFLKAGCGYGGSCLPKDLSALIASRQAAGEEHPLLEAVRTVNDSQAGRVVGLLERSLGNLAGRPIGVLGLAFKAGTDDVRTSPGLRAVEELLTRGAEVFAYDPLVRLEAVLPWREQGLTLVDGVQELMSKVQGCLIATGDPAFAAVADVAALHGTLLLDGRRLLAADELGSRHLAVGRAVPHGPGDDDAGTPVPS